MSGSIWERFPYDPRRPDHAALRASDADRDVANDILGTAYADGRISPAELDERSDQVARAKTLGELPAVIDDLVAPTSALSPVIRDKRAEAERRYRQQRQQALYSFLTPTLICWVIYVSLLIGGGGTPFPWPVFVTIGTGMRFFQLATSKEDSIVSIERDLEKKERKALESRERKALEADHREDQGEPGMN